MNILSNNKEENTIQQKFQDILKFDSESDKIEFEAQMIHLDLMNNVRELMKSKNIENYKQLAELLSSSPSYVTQLFSGEKLANLKLLAKFQRIFNIKFNIVPNQYIAYKESFRNMLAQKGYDSYIAEGDSPPFCAKKIA